MTLDRLCVADAQTLLAEELHRPSGKSVESACRLQQSIIHDLKLERIKMYDCLYFNLIYLFLGFLN